MQTIDSAYSLPLAVMLSRYSAPGRVSIPVPSSQVIYAHFEHVLRSRRRRGPMRPPWTASRS
ncbi:MAG: hypothetical protein M0C28_25765 [Candidatus Moduliflexus flocculans]|nr:hypothetical protein [Candidatus Moduliflexus flocculans]